MASRGLLVAILLVACVNEHHVSVRVTGAQRNDAVRLAVYRGAQCAGGRPATALVDPVLPLTRVNNGTISLALPGPGLYTLVARAADATSCALPSEGCWADGPIEAAASPIDVPLMGIVVGERGCEAPLVCDDGLCVSPDGDAGQPIVDGGNTQIDSGRLLCAGNQCDATCCNNATCVDPRTDPTHCGDCDHTCGAGARCAASACQLDVMIGDTGGASTVYVGAAWFQLDARYPRSPDTIGFMTLGGATDRMVTLAVPNTPQPNDSTIVCRRSCAPGSSGCACEGTVGGLSAPAVAFGLVAAATAPSTDPADAKAWANVVLVWASRAITSDEYAGLGPSGSPVASFLPTYLPAGGLQRGVTAFLAPGTGPGARLGADASAVGFGRLFTMPPLCDVGTCPPPAPLDPH